MRKIQMFFVTLLMVFMATIGIAQAQTLLYADTVWAKPGEDVTVPVMISENSGLAYADLSVTFSNEYMTVTGATKGTVLPGTMITNLTKSGVVLEELTEATVIISGDPGETPQDGTLFSLNFHVKETAKEGLIPVTVAWEESSLMNANGEEIAAETKEGGVYVPKQFTVSFYVEDALYDTQSVYENEKAQMPTVPQNGDQLFLGWFEDASDSAWNFALNVVNEDVTLSARFAHQPVEVVASTLHRYNQSVLADVTVKNFSASENLCLVLGFFDAEGRMLCAVSDEITVAVGNTYTMSETVLEANAVNVKVLAFTALADLTPVINTKDRSIVDAAKISFLTFGGTEIADIYVAKGSKITTEIPVPEKEGSKFGGWYKNVNETWNFKEDIVTQDVILQAKWDVATYSIVFVTDGEVYDTQTIAYQNKIVRPEAPVKDHYVFNCWYEKTDDAGNPVPFDFDEPVARDITLEAAFDMEAYTVYFVTGTDVEIPEQTVNYMDYAEEPAISREHYIFDGWFTEEACENEWVFTEMPVQGEMTLYAGWTPESYTIEFVTGHGATKVPEQTVSYGEYVVVPEEPTHPYGTFEGWYQDEAYEAPFDFEVLITASCTLYAKWAYDQVPVYLHNGEEIIETSVTYGALMADPGAPDGDGSSDFMGWYTEADYQNLWDFASNRVYEETHLFALWELQYFDVIFVTGHGATTVETQSVAYGTCAIEPEAPTHDYGTFEGWYTDDSYAVAFDFETPIKSKTTIYAKWTYEMITVYFNNEGEITETDVPYGSLLTAPNLPEEKEGYTFEGWYADEAKTTLWVFEANKVYEEITLYAGWKAITYKVTFDVGEGTYITPRTCAYGTAVEEPARIPTRIGYDFTGWYTDSAATQSYDFSEKIYQETTLYAGWADVSTLNYIYFNGGAAEADVTMDADAIVVSAFIEDITSSAEQTPVSFVYGGETVTLSVVASTKTGYVRVGEAETSFTLPATALQLTTSYMLKTVDGMNWSVLCNNEEVATIASVKTEKEEAFGGKFVVANNADGTAPFVGYIRTMELRKEGDVVANFDFRIEKDADTIVSDEENITLTLTGTYALDSVNYTGINDIAYPDFAPGYGTDGIWNTWGAWCGDSYPTHSAFDNVLTIKHTKNTSTISLSMYDQVYETSKQRNIYTAAEITPVAFSSDVANEGGGFRFVGLGNNKYVRDVPAKRLVIFDKEENAQIGTTYYLDKVTASTYTLYSFGLSTITYGIYNGCSFQLYKPVVIDIDAHGLSGYTSQRLNFLVSGR